MTGSLRRGSIVLIAAAIATACDRILPRDDDVTLPPVEVVDSIYRANGVEGARVSYSGNVVELRARQGTDQLQRGGSLWARVGPYVYLFSPGTRALFDNYAGIAAVRAITETPAGVEIARALLPRTALEETRWRRANNLLARALQEGTERPSQIEALVHWGEEYTEYQYNPNYVPPRQ